MNSNKTKMMLNSNDIITVKVVAILKWKSMYIWVTQSRTARKNEHRKIRQIKLKLNWAAFRKLRFILWDEKCSCISQACTYDNSIVPV